MLADNRNLLSGIFLTSPWTKKFTSQLTFGLSIRFYLTNPEQVWQVIFAIKTVPHYIDYAQDIL